MRNTVFMFLLAALFSSCLKDELPIPARDKGVSMQTCMGTGYRDQLWVDLGSGTVVSSNPLTAWDLGFESGADGWHIRLNSAKKMSVLNKGAVDITQPHDTTGLLASGRFDTPNGHSDSTAIGDWRGTDAVYIIDLGINHLGQRQGYRKFRFTSVSATEFTFDVAALNGSDLNTVVVTKDPSRSSTCYKTGQGVVAIEPPKGEWDLVMTRYTHLFRDPFMPYMVSGALLAPTTRAAMLSGAVFDAVSLSDTTHHPMSSARDVIGYDWKTYLFEPTSGYVVDESMVFIIEDAAGVFRKLHFIDFYNEQGQSGCPLFKMELL